MIKRTEYLKWLIDFKDKNIIKVITGIRRCGKSTLLAQYIDYLKSSSVSDKQIININFESARFSDISTWKDLYDYVSARIVSGQKTYILLDEVQEIEEFERAVNSFMVDYDVDIYITGSNAYLLSSEISTILSGRYVEINMLPLSFKEYMDAQSGNESTEDCFYSYLKYGSFPFVAEERKESVIDFYLNGIYSTVILKDVIQRNKIKDPALLNKVINFVFSSIGSPVSPVSISKVLRNENTRISNETIEVYLEMLCKAFILSKAVRYDIKGKAYLKTLNKYYVTDLGLRNRVLGYRHTDTGHALENVIYFELVRRGYKVDVGKIGDTEVDFVARSKNEIKYYQVAWTVNDNQQTLDREYKPFDSIRDHYEKTIITMDKDFISSINGVKKINAIDFLLGKVPRHNIGDAD